MFTEPHLNTQRVGGILDAEIGIQSWPNVYYNFMGSYGRIFQENAWRSLCLISTNSIMPSERQSLVKVLIRKGFHEVIHQSRYAKMTRTDADSSDSFVIGGWQSRKGGSFSEFSFIAPKKTRKKEVSWFSALSSSKFRLTKMKATLLPKLVLIRGTISQMQTIQRTNQS